MGNANVITSDFGQGGKREEIVGLFNSRCFSGLALGLWKPGF